jgi:alcohol dehydrogenase, propanol-preferring
LSTTVTSDHDQATPKVHVGYHAAVVREFGQPLVVEEVSAQELTPDQIRVRIEACGLCHTDIHAANGDWPIKPQPPFIPGHEGVGRVVELGSAVTGVTLGERVAMPWLGYACGICDY